MALAIGDKTTMSRSRQFVDGWRHAEKSLVAWLYSRSNGMNDPHAKSILNVVADDFGKWAKGRYRVYDLDGPPCAEDPLAVFQAAVRREALEEAARIVEGYGRDSKQGSAILGDIERRKLTNAIRAAME